MIRVNFCIHFVNNWSIGFILLHHAIRGKPKVFLRSKILLYDPGEVEKYEKN